jgi:hypothetical protein
MKNLICFRYIKIFVILFIFFTASCRGQKHYHYYKPDSNYRPDREFSRFDRRYDRSRYNRNRYDRNRSEDFDYAQRRRYEEEYNRLESQFGSRVRPSESMQVGVRKDHNFDIIEYERRSGSRFRNAQNYENKSEERKYSANEFNKNKELSKRTVYEEDLNSELEVVEESEINIKNQISAKNKINEKSEIDSKIETSQKEMRLN